MSKRENGSDGATVQKASDRTQRFFSFLGFKTGDENE
jgi:hypothetical protein